MYTHCMSKKIVIPYETLKDVLPYANSLADIRRLLHISLKSHKIVAMLKMYDLFNDWISKSNQYVRFIPIEECLVKNSPVRSNGTLKERLLKNGMLKNECDLCKGGPEWKGQVLVLQLDHINGDNKDNRLENLRILCPNCHTQTETHSGKRFRKTRVAKKCVDCSVDVKAVGSVRCLQCSRNFSINSAKERVPSIDILYQECKETSLNAVVRKYGINRYRLLDRFAEANYELKSLHRYTRGKLLNTIVSDTREVVCEDCAKPLPGDGYTVCKECLLERRKKEAIKNIPDTKTLYEELVNSSGRLLGKKYGKKKSFLFKLLEQDGYNVDTYKPKYR